MPSSSLLRLAVIATVIVAGASASQADQADVPPRPIAQPYRADTHPIFAKEVLREGHAKKSLPNKVLNDPATTAVIPPLPQVNVDADSITISGFDSGAIFANQLQIAYSSIIKGAGLVSGVPYMCSEGTLVGAAACIANPFAIMIEALMSQTLIFEGLGMIDNLQNLANQYTMVFSSPADAVVSHLSTELMVEMLSSMGATNIDTVYNFTDAGHAWITNNLGNNPCAYSGSPYINDCQFSFGNVFLKKALNFLGIPTTPLPSTPSPNNANSTLPELLLFNQGIFGADPSDNSMDAGGYAFIPPQCYRSSGSNITCRLHLNFHGCEQSRSSMGTSYVSQTGLNTQWALDNNIVIVYPQAAPNSLKFNPMGCWDWFNYNNQNFYTNWGEFATKNGVQISIVSHIIDSILTGE